MRALLLVFFLFITPLALGQDLPRYDPEAYCQADTDSPSLYNLCIEDEQGYYNDLRQSWNDVPDDIKSYCIEDNRDGIGLPSYSMLELCVSDEVEAASNVSTFSFD
ncbi:hypothetical protein [Halomonas denitrificans]|uniref:hypothetical protein n=1 Tax=Halomonas denitrificans TaxID=370769 RepID=UPI001C9A14E0|nr:hypothetical protein [Halomonas denitrificans]MBY5969901.1 hypothetical protein [Halomonas denitrificans]